MPKSRFTDEQMIGVPRDVAPLALALRAPCVDATLCTEHALVSMLAQLEL